MMKLAGLLFILIAHIFILSRLTFTAWPEMLAYPYLFSNGFLLYRDFIVPYTPGLVLFLSAIFQNFGFNVEVLKYLTWGLILIEDILLYLILIRLIGYKGLMGLIFLGVFVILQAFLEGNMLWFDFAIVLPLLLAFYFALKWLETKRLHILFLVSLFLTVAVLIKQTTGLYFLGILGGVREARGIREMGVIGGGILILIIPLIIYLQNTESLLSFWNWIFFYPLTEWSKFPGYVNFTLSKRELLITFLLISPLTFALISFKKLLAEKIFLLTIAFLAAALIAIYPRFSFFHMQPAIAFLLIAFAQIFLKLPKKWQQIYLPHLIFSIIFIIGLSFKASLGESIRFYSKDDQILASKIVKEIENPQTTFFLGVNSSEYVFAGKLPPKNWSDNFGWYLEIPGAQEWVIEGLESDPPKKILWRIPSPGYWYNLGSYQPQKIIEYIKTHYHKTGNIDKGIEIWERI